MAVRNLLVILLLGAAALVAACGLVAPALAHHNGPKLPGIPTPLIKNLLADGEVTYCADARATAYPGFMSQLRQVTEYAYQVSGIPAREVPFGVGCDVTHTMPDAFPCGAGAYACIYYNAPKVTIAYNYRMGYSDNRSAQCHEGTNSGHAMGLHEQYDDINFKSLQKYWTCMDFGTFVWQMTAWDKDQVHSWLLPKDFTYVGSNRHPDGTPFIFYCGADTSGTATQVSLMAIAPWGDWYWSGIHLPVSSGCVGQNIISDPGWCFALNQENGFNWKREDLRKDRIGYCHP